MHVCFDLLNTDCAQVNFLSHVYLTMSLLPSLKRARRPRIICTTSCMQYLGNFDLTNTTSAKKAYSNNKLYFQTWLTELQHRMSKTSSYRHVTVQGVHPGFVKTNIFAQTQGNDPVPRVGRVVGAVLDWYAIDAQQGSLGITHAATAPESGTELDEPRADGGGKYFNRIWEAEPMPQTRHPECRRQIWEYVNRELRLDKKGLLKDVDFQDD
jgi:NAD(P)-dependent dehydrogenase (short-subunit alcohol dehydrogenase family)